jgi:hypothetical protein
MTTITTIDDEIREVVATINKTHVAAAQAKVLAMRQRARGDQRGADIAAQVASKLDDVILQLGYIEADLAIRKHQLIVMAATRIDTEFRATWSDEQDYRESQADHHLLMEMES